MGPVNTATATDRSPWTTLRLPRAEPAFVHASGAEFESLDPSTGERVAVLAGSTAADVDAAVARGCEAFAATAWQHDSALRARVLFRLAASLRGERERLADLLSREQGKTIYEARVEIAGAAAMVEYYAGLARAVYGRSAILGDAVHGVILREPLGVVAVITPWNWPLTLLVRSLAPALAAGNTAIVKPASLTAAVTVESLALLAADDELPTGVLTCVLGSGGTVGDRVVGHEGVDMIAFTGASTTGTHIMRRAADRLCKVSLELGGKSPNIVFADAELDKALAGATNAAFTTCGQICTAGSRLLVHDSIYAEFVDRLADATASMRIGDALDPQSQLGPVVSADQKDSIVSYVELGEREGTLVTGGNDLGPEYAGGHFVAPAIVADLPLDSRVVREEIFGPVLVVHRFGSESEAVALANDTEFGLAAGLWTSDLNRAWRVGRAIQAGTVWINTYHHFYDEAEVGGIKRSGVGRQQGIEGLHEFTETKHLNFDGTAALFEEAR